MRYIVFSDIHGNVAALKAMVNDIVSENCEGIIFCGDIIGYFYQQEEIIKCFSSWSSSLYAVLGNHDFNYLMSLKCADNRTNYAREYGKSYITKLSDSALSFLQDLPQIHSIIIDNKKVLIVHGEPGNYLNGRIYPDTEIKKEIYGSYDVVFLGHTHYKMIRTCGKTLVINPGSLGQPRDGKGFSYCIFDFNEMKAEFRTVEVNKRKLLDEMVAKKESTELIHYIEDTFKREYIWTRYS